MKITDGILKGEEKVVFALRSLYGKYGYRKYRMSKFEEYDLYVRNKDFLVSDHIITFTDTNGRLMALKPDVTLSIIKNGKDMPGYTEKVYYNENVYRVSKGTDSFREIMQTGLECMGEIDTYQLYEVLMLAAESLKIISGEAVLDISHLGILREILEDCGVTGEARQEALRCIGEKNLHELEGVCEEAGITPENTARLKKLTMLYGAPKEVLPELSSLMGRETEELLKLRQIAEMLESGPCGDMIRIDFSVVNDMRYYSGIVFRGFVQGVPAGILSGGQYDRLMQKLGRKAGAVGFAVYLDLLERLFPSEQRYDVDTVLLYDEGTELETLCAAVKALEEGGVSVSAQRRTPEKLKYRRLLKLTEKGAEELENHA